MRDEAGGLYQALCLLLSERGEQFDWSALSPDQWLTLGALAQEHGVAPLAYRQFEALGWPAGSQSGIQQTWMDSYYQSAAQSATLYHELDLILTTLDQDGIPVVLLKGAHLASALYVDIALRPMNDLDLLVHEADLERAQAALAAIGYNQPYPVISQGLNRDLGHHIYLSRENSSLPGLELHWSLLGGKADRRAAPAGWFWEHTLPLPPSGPRHHALALDPGANLLFLAAHLYLKHYGDSGRLIWLVDIYLLLERWGEAVDWRAVIVAAAEFGWTRGAVWGAARRAGGPGLAAAGWRNGRACLELPWSLRSAAPPGCPAAPSRPCHAGQPRQLQPLRPPAGPAGDALPQPGAHALALPAAPGLAVAAVLPGQVGRHAARRAAHPVGRGGGGIALRAERGSWKRPERSNRNSTDLRNIVIVTLMLGVAIAALIPGIIVSFRGELQILTVFGLFSIRTDQQYSGANT